MQTNRLKPTDNVRSAPHSSFRSAFSQARQESRATVGSVAATAAIEASQQSYEV